MFYKHDKSHTSLLPLPTRGWEIRPLSGPQQGSLKFGSLARKDPAMRHLLILSFLLSPVALTAGCSDHDHDDHDHDRTVKTETKVSREGDHGYTKTERTVRTDD